MLDKGEYLSIKSPRRYLDHFGEWCRWLMHRPNQAEMRLFFHGDCQISQGQYTECVIRMYTAAPSKDAQHVIRVFTTFFANWRMNALTTVHRNGSSYVDLTRVWAQVDRERYVANLGGCEVLVNHDARKIHIWMLASSNERWKATGLSQCCCCELIFQPPVGSLLLEPCTGESSQICNTPSTAWLCAWMSEAQCPRERVWLCVHGGRVLRDLHTMTFSYAY